AGFRKQAIEELREELSRQFTLDASSIERKPSDEETELQRLAFIERQANAAVALIRLEDTRPVYEFLTVDRDPEALSQFIYRIRGREVSPLLLINSFRELESKAVPENSVERRQHFYRLYGFLLGLGEFTFDQLPAQQRDILTSELVAMYGTHPSRAVHSALGWLLRRWGQDELVRRVDETPLDYDESGKREWYVLKIDPPAPATAESVRSMVGRLSDHTKAVPTAAKDSANKPVIDLLAPLYFTMIVFPGGEFEMGDPENSRRIKVTGPIAVCDQEVTWQHFSSFDADSHRQEWERKYKKTLEAEDPAFGVNWYEAVNFCRWLTSARGLDEKSQSYIHFDFPSGLESNPGWLNLPAGTEWPMRAGRPGFRLLTDEEWEYVARYGTGTTYSFGNSESLLAEYNWYTDNSDQWSHRTKQL
ncbi:MAG: SUMF1/EgtB/PvdO family nonheme iron enzyme, partial [Planctomycetaceae bacterium]|nr:SUMF1/EgtB/PvdO family nonheme iron enzyme [Planctomycetaceae bacterium]